MSSELDIKAFRDFCATKPADEIYEYWSEDCAYGQFIKASGFEVTIMGTNYWYGSDSVTRHKIPYPIDDLVDGIMNHTEIEHINKIRNFGALTKRLDAVIQAGQT